MTILTSARTTTFVFLTSILMAAGCFGCEDECDFDRARCDANVLESCADGPDRVVPRRIDRTTCEGSEPFCVSTENGASCAASAALCDEATFVSSCEGSVRTYCSTTFVRANDCSSYGPECLIHEGEAKCGLEPATPCDFQTYRRRCEGTVLRACTDGIESAVDCDERCFEDADNDLAYCTSED